MSSYFSNRWPLSYLNLTKNMKTYIRRQQHKTILNTKTQNKKNHHRSIDLERSVTQSYWRVSILHEFVHRKRRLCTTGDTTYTRHSDRPICDHTVTPTRACRHDVQLYARSRYCPGKLVKSAIHRLNFSCLLGISHVISALIEIL